MVDDQDGITVQTPESAASLADVLNRDDPGDEMQRNIAYQHAYGVILLIAAANGDKPYSALWCEHHDDFLGQRHDGLFTAYQIKTRRPELGAWTMGTDAMKHSLKRFVTLEQAYPGQLAEFYFVSNTEFSDAQGNQDLSKSPRRFLLAVGSVATHVDLSEPFTETFVALKKYCDCEDTLLFNVLGRVRLVVGPARQDFESVVAHEHVSRLDGCAGHDPAKLNGLRDELIQKVSFASNLGKLDASRHWCPLDGDDTQNPALTAKKIDVQSILEFVKEQQPIPFRFAPTERMVKIGAVEIGVSRLEQKMIRGGLADQVDSMRTKTLSAEKYFFELMSRKPHSWEQTLNQVENFVKGECDEAQLEASHRGPVYGRFMLSDVNKRLRTAAKERPRMVHGVEPECLIGLAGALTAECQVWWSEKFQLEETS
jgi:Cap4 dsDNA endonuclease